MTILEILLLISTIFLTLISGISLYFNFKHGLLILKTTDLIENALDSLDERYESINKILEIPIFYDSPQIRQVLDDIELSRDSILKVANYLASVENVNEQEFIEQ